MVVAGGLVCATVAIVVAIVVMLRNQEARQEQNDTVRNTTANVGMVGRHTLQDRYDQSEYSVLGNSSIPLLLDNTIIGDWPVFRKSA